MQVYLEGPNYQNPMIFSNENAIHSLRFFNKTKAASFLKQISSGIPFNWFSHQILERLVLGVWCLVPQASPSEKLGNCKFPNSSLVMHSCSRLTADTLHGVGEGKIIGPDTRLVTLPMGYPIGSMYGIYTYIWLIFMVNVGEYTIHGSYGYGWNIPEKRIVRFFRNWETFKIPYPNDQTINPRNWRKVGVLDGIGTNSFVFWRWFFWNLKETIRQLCLGGKRLSTPPQLFFDSWFDDLLGRSKTTRKSQDVFKSKWWVVICCLPSLKLT